MDNIQHTADESIFTNNVRFYINKNEVHIWWIDECMQTQFQHSLLELLSEDEKRRANRYIIKENKNRYIFFRGILRIILSKYIDSTPDEIKFRYLNHGKPKLSNIRHSSQTTNLQFNISHSGHKGIIGIVLNREIGVDLEQEKPIQHMDAIARNYFSAFEFEKYNRLEGINRQKAFYTCWTRKEAYLKATGRGFDLPMNRFSVSPLPEENHLLIENKIYPQDINKWELIQISPEPDITAAIVYKAR